VFEVGAVFGFVFAFALDVVSVRGCTGRSASFDGAVI
jgi:hypothetical protein